MDSQLNILHKNVANDYASGITPYEENEQLTDNIASIVNEKNPFRRINNIKKIRSSYNALLSKSHIEYYIRIAKKQIIDSILTLLFIFFLFFGLFFTLQKINIVYQQNNIIINENSLKQAINCYETGDYQAALTYLEKLYEYGWNDLTTINYLSSSYEALGNYDAAAKILLKYLENIGLANVSTENSIYLRLKQLDIDSSFKKDIKQPISDILSNNLWEKFDFIMNCDWTYAQIRNCIRDQNYVEAEDLCKNLSQVGANGFYYIAYYSYILISTNRYTEAYDLVMDFVRDDASIISQKMIPAIQRKSLVNYIIPYLDDIQVADCKYFLENELYNLDIISDNEITEPYIYYDDVEYLFKYLTNFNELNLLESIDSINIDYDTTFFNGDECYYIKLNHYDAGNIKPYHFLMDMEKNVYIFIDGKYIYLPTDEGSDPPENGYNIPTKQLINVKNPEISMIVNFDEAGTASYSIINTSTNEIILDTSTVSYSDYNFYTYFENKEVEFTTFFSSFEDGIILVTRDSLDKHSLLEGYYTISN